MQHNADRFWMRLPAAFGVCLITAFAAFTLSPAPATAASRALANLDGNWSGGGTLRPGNGTAERIRCKGQYRPIGSHEVNLKLRCASDSYNFNLSSQFSADERDHISGSWTEHNRGVTGSVAGIAQGNRLLVRAESPGFSADMYMVTSGRRQSVSIESHAGGQDVKASITLHRR